MGTRAASGSCVRVPNILIRHFFSNEGNDGPLFVVGHKDALHSHAWSSMPYRILIPEFRLLMLHRRKLCNTVTRCRFEDYPEGTWVLTPEWSGGIFNVLDQIPVKWSSEEHGTVTKLRPRDQVVSKGGRSSIDFLGRPATLHINCGGTMIVSAMSMGRCRPQNIHITLNLTVLLGDPRCCCVPRVFTVFTNPMSLTEPSAAQRVIYR